MEARAAEARAADVEAAAEVKAAASCKHSPRRVPWKECLAIGLHSRRHSPCFGGLWSESSIGWQRVCAATWVRAVRCERRVFSRKSGCFSFQVNRSVWRKFPLVAPPPFLLSPAKPCPQSRPSSRGACSSRRSTWAATSPTLNLGGVRAARRIQLRLTSNMVSLQISTN